MFDAKESGVVNLVSHGKGSFLLDLDVFHFGVLSNFAQVFLIHPHLNADPEFLLISVRRIETEE